MVHRRIVVVTIVALQLLELRVCERERETLHANPGPSRENLTAATAGSFAGDPNAT